MLENDGRLRALGFKFDAPVNSVAYTRDGEAFALGLGNGGVHLVHGDTRQTLAVHKGAVPCLKALGPDKFISLSDDGTLKIISKDGAVTDMADFKGTWTERMDTHKNGGIAVAVGKHVHYWANAESAVRILGPHDSTVNDVCFAADGMGLAAAHRDGVSLWAMFGKGAPHFEPQKMLLPWKGAHLAVTISGDKRWIVSAMQESALHIWNVALKRDYQMRGYWNKPTQLAWSADRKWLATSGAEAVVIWPFDKAGPEGREPLQIGWSNSALVTALAAHTEAPVLAAGFADGAVVMIDLISRKSFSATAPSGHAVTAIAFSPQGDSLVAGTDNGGGVHIELAE